MKLIFSTFLTLALVSGKIYDRCELARELLTVHRAPLHQIPIWVCIAEHESQYMTHVVGNMSGDGSGDHGLFQINDRYWCSPPGEGHGCGMSCSKLHDDDISDDFNCVQKIYKEHKKLQGDGFKAWAVYQPHCKGHKAKKYIKNCFDDIFEQLSNNEVTSDPLNDFFNNIRENEISAFSSNTTFDAFFTPRKSVLLSSTDYLTTSKPTTINSNKESKVNLNNPFLFNSLQSSLPVSENTAIKFSNPSTKLYYLKVTSTTPQFPYINRLAFFTPTTINPFSTDNTVATPPKSFASKFNPLPNVNTVKTSTKFSAYQFKSLPTTSTVRTPSTFSASQFGSLPTISTVQTPSAFSASQFRALPTVSTVRTPSAFSASQFRALPTVSTVRTPSTFSASQFGSLPTISTVQTPSAFSASQFRALPTVSTVRTPSAFSASQFRSSPAINIINSPSTFSASQFRSFSVVNEAKNPSIFSASQFRPVPPVRRISIPSTLQTSNYKLLPSVNTVRIASVKSSSNFRPFYSTSTLGPTSSLQTSKSFFVPSPTASSYFRPSTTIYAKTTSRQPVFIFNGVKWY